MATIYINPTVSGTGSGTLNDPYKSWASVTWVAGNTYLQAGDTTFNGAILVTVTGSSSNPIVLGSYDPATGARTTGGVKRARLNGAGTRLTLRTSANIHWVTFDNFEVFGTDGTPGGPAIGIYLGSSETAPSDDCTVSNCWIHDINGSLFPASDCNGLTFFGSRNRIVNNLIENIPADGIWGQGSTSYIVGNTIRNVSKDNIRGDCIQLYGTATLRNDNAYIAFNYLDHRNKESKQVIISGDATYSSGTLIESNVCLMTPYAGAIQTTCIMAEGAGSIVRDNICFGGFNGIYLTSSNSKAIGNIVDTNTVGITQAPTATGALVAHNVCLRSTYLGIQADSDATFRAFNNILVSCANGVGLAGSENGNAFWLCTTNKIARVGSPTYGALTVTSNPLFVDLTKPWLGLKAGSPCERAGAYIQGARDRFGRRYLNPPNIGPWAVIGR